VKDHDFDALIQGAKEAIEHAGGRTVNGAVVHAGIDVAGIRAGMGLSQTAFAGRFGFSVATVRQWEQGRRQPRGPARTLLVTLQHEPEAVLRSLERGERNTA